MEKGIQFSLRVPRHILRGVSLIWYVANPMVSAKFCLIETCPTQVTFNYKKSDAKKTNIAEFSSQVMCILNGNKGIRVDHFKSVLNCGLRNVRLIIFNHFFCSVFFIYYGIEEKVYSNNLLNQWDWITWLRKYGLKLLLKLLRKSFVADLHIYEGPWGSNWT